MKELPIPGFYTQIKIDEVWPLDYHQLATDARNWAQKYAVPPTAKDTPRVALLIIDNQVTFCMPPPWGQLPVEGALDSVDRLCRFIYTNMGRISAATATLDTHTTKQIFHNIFWINEKGENPVPGTVISLDDLKKGEWRVNPALSAPLGVPYAFLMAHVRHYVEQLEAKGKYNLFIWPYHAMLGGAGHILVPAVEQALRFYGFVRNSKVSFETKGGNPLTENYSVLGPEVTDTIVRKGGGVTTIDQKNVAFIQTLLNFDRIIIAGQAKSHCVAWTIQDLLDEILGRQNSAGLVKKVYLLEDCTDPVIVRDDGGNVLVDFTDEANKAFQRFKDAGMHVVQSTTKMEDWPDMF